MSLNQDYIKIGYDIIGSSFQVRKVAGRNLREQYYRDALAWELREKGYTIEKEVLIPALYKGIEIDDAYRADIVVDNRVIIEVKALRAMGEIECRQILTYLTLSNFKLGYLINFGAKEFHTGKLEDTLPYSKGIYRIVHDIED